MGRAGQAWCGQEARRTSRARPRTKVISAAILTAGIWGAQGKLSADAGSVAHFVRERPRTKLSAAMRASYRHQHAVAAGIALHDRARRHAHDRRMLAAVRTDRGKLEPPQAVHAAIAPRQVRRAKPRLRAMRAQRTEVDVVRAHVSHPRSSCQPRRILAMKKPAVRSRSGRVSSVSAAPSPHARARAGSSSSKSGWEARKASICCSFSAREIVHVE